MRTIIKRTMVIGSLSILYHLLLIVPMSLVMLRMHGFRVHMDHSRNMMIYMVHLK
uniref:Uncharacterized protein n=1 Tax=Arundo donax TaxID=35708 RepID=A0A0A9A8Q4_ARUDO